MMSGRTAQRKGRRAELELVQLLQQAGYPATPGKAESYGTEPDIIGLPGVHIEVKRRERAALPEWLKQARGDAQRFGDGIPAVFHRGNRQGWMVTLALDDFLKLYDGGISSGARPRQK